MGIFNFFIVIPEITASLGFGWIMGHLLNNNRIAAVVTGGVFFILAAMLTQRVEDLYDIRQQSGSLAGSTVAEKSRKRVVSFGSDSPPANGHEFRFHRDTAGDFHSDQRFERLGQSREVWNLMQQFFH